MQTYTVCSIKKVQIINREMKGEDKKCLRHWNLCKNCIKYIPNVNRKIFRSCKRFKTIFKLILKKKIEKFVANF